MAYHMLRKISLFLLVSFTLVAVFLVPAPAVAAVAQPDQLTIERLEAYENVIEPTDQLYIVSFDIDYAVSPGTYTANDIFLVRLMDGATELGVTSPYAYYNDGYSYGVVGLYFSASDVSTLGMTFGAGTGYSAQICGNPLLTWDGGTAPQESTGTFAIWLSSDNPTTYLTNRIRTIAQNVEDEWSGAINLIEGMAGERTLTSYGEDYFTNSIPNLILITPDAFSASRSMPEMASKGYQSDYYVVGNDNTFLPVYSGTWAFQSFTASDTYTIDRAEVEICRVGTPATDLQVRIYTNSGTAPGTMVCSGTITATNVSAYNLGEWNEVSFIDGYELTESGSYSIVLCTTGGNITNYYQWRGKTDGNYAGGHPGHSHNSGSAWTVNSGDMQFITKGEGAYSRSFAKKLSAQLDGSVFDTQDAADSLGLSRNWLNGLIWFAVTVVLAVGIVQTTQTTKAVVWVILIMTPIGAAVGFVDIYVAAFVMFVSFLIAIYSVAWEKSG